MGMKGHAAPLHYPSPVIASDQRERGNPTRSVVARRSPLGCARGRLCNPSEILRFALNFGSLAPLPILLGGDVLGVMGFFSFTT